MKFKLLSVAEDGNRIDCISGRQNGLVLTIHTDRTLVVTGLVTGREFKISNLDIDGMIAYLQDAKQFVSESEMMRKLRG